MSASTHLGRHNKGLGDRIDVFEIEQFVALNVIAIDNIRHRRLPAAGDEFPELVHCP